MRRRLLALTRAVLAGWAGLFLLIYLLERPLLRWTGPLLGPSWYATVQLALDCLMLAGAGWIAGRLGSMSAVLTFAATLTPWDFGQTLAMNIPWLVHLAADAVRDSRYFDAFTTSFATHALLFGSLFAGAWWSRPQTKPPSLFPLPPDSDQLQSGPVSAEDLDRASSDAKVTGQ